VTQLRAAWLVAVVDLRRRLRNRSLLIQALVGPMVLATIISLAFGTGMSLDVEVGVVDSDRSPLATGFARGLVTSSGDGLDFVAVDDDRDARRQVDDGDLGAVVVVPEGFMASLAGDRPGDVEVITDDGQPIAAAVARSVADSLTARANAARLAGATVVADGGTAPSPAELARIELPITTRQRGSGDEVSPAAYFGPSMGLLFLFLTVGVVSRGLLDERRRHVLDRMRAAPVRPWAILAGKCASTVVLAALSLATIWLVTGVALGADWGDPAGVVLLIGAAALAVAGIAGVVAAVARTEQAADTFATVVAFTLALIGGNFIPPGDLPDTLRRISLVSPNGWALQGFAELSAGGGTVADVLPHVAVLVAWGLVTGAVAAVLLPRRLEAAP
jgi:linearmycin/streptolysin S transport system permease protein